MRYETLEKKVLEYSPGADTGLLRRAWEFAAQAHAGQQRISGKPYIEHPLAVGGLLAELQLDLPTVAAGLLHDVVEDCAVTSQEVQERFGGEVAGLVEGVTKLGRLSFRSREEEQGENLRKMFLAMAKDIRVILIKLADRLHNMRTLRHLAPERQLQIAQETLEIYAPLAHRLGIFRMKWELEDLSFRYLEPERYRELVKKVAARRREREAYIEQIITTLRESLAGAGIAAEIQGRPKHFYSIYRKMWSQGKAFDQIYDLMAVRVVVATVQDCYAVLGLVHTLWKPMPGRFKDYIAMPKSNMYQSLHTTLIGAGGDTFEIQIRTREMHRTAEFGIAAHWRYKEGGRADTLDDKLAWLRGLLEWQRDLRDARDFMDNLKVDLFDDEVFVFTPKGDVVDLPADSTPLDFAYRIHTDVGHHCVGAKCNGKIVPLEYRLKNGDIVEVLTNKSSGPSADWLNIVQTAGAKNRIRQWFKAKNREENLQRGREALEREVRRQGFESHELLRPEWLEEASRRYNLQLPDDLFVSVGYGGLSAQQVVNRLREEHRKSFPGPAPRETGSWTGFGKPSNGVRVKGIDNVLVRFSRCCSPVPGEPIIGYVTRGRGVSVHRADCPNARHLAGERERAIEVAWDQAVRSVHPVELQVHALDRSGLSADVFNAVADNRVNILNAKVRTFKNHTALIDVVIEVQHMGELQSITDRIRRVDAVLSVERVAKELSH
ncbi:MAG: bifunctional (p)ppGpp synthetase/guanosine-3',5'-bis(diphosphate) 3'-pyrophosphohydrolase [Thermaerobacter sp.]|nr:bifunctional (p)ppGpp synthetase/guanosine-3',5'-bis(diphosphate) 3'-pyrophosphohydrolase [Thermaerobacter sp.]